MTDVIANPEELNPTNGERNNENLQNNSGESTQPENAETKNGSGRRHYRKDNKIIANFKRTRDQKKQKEERLNKEIADKKADLDRGYLIVPLGDDTEKVKHVTLDITDKEIIKAVIEEKKLEKFDVEQEIKKIDNDILILASAKRSTNRNKLNKKKAYLKESELVKRIDKELDKASKNGSKDLVSKIEQQVKEGKTVKAYESLKSFLSQEVKTVSKKLSKSSQLEQKVLERVLDKLNTSES
ncbi:MAG: hypothetical protein HND40_15975 [Ignavibacteriota bacterium]|nr:hypothetical protein [Ignavibacteriota bacterium]MCO6448910.1 hypothetical protein [Ignavibacterium album]MCZ2267840.1 hypothetical protein [Ignavibacteriales bacterium]QKK00958.1 MAG: hypothetical protein HND40_15975 [Ignavibacteriota bacterium]HOJ07776.1 hypothetical protein [Ignavibacteriaceae bacterium]